DYFFYTDNNHNGTIDPADSIWVDSFASDGTFQAYDQVVNGPTPTVGTQGNIADVLSYQDGNRYYHAIPTDWETTEGVPNQLCYYDSNGDGQWEQTETIWYDAQGDNKFDSGDPIVYNSGTMLMAGSWGKKQNLYYWDKNGDGR